MTEAAPSVASVLLIAAEPRERELAPWLRVVGEPVRYMLHTLTPHDAFAFVRASPWSWDVVVIDGESIEQDHDREALLHTLRERGHLLSSLLYIYRACPSDIEAEHVLTWADDEIAHGSQFGTRLRRRVQCLALAPWRRSIALRLEASLSGHTRMRLVRNGDEPR